MIWVDPPSGWKYGFPRIWNQEGEMRDWILSKGYPQKEIDSYGDFFHVRMWEANEEEIKDVRNY